MDSLLLTIYLAAFIATVTIDTYQKIQHQGKKQ